MRDARGRKVEGNLVQDPETGYWREERRSRKSSRSGLDYEFILARYAEGRSRGEITCLYVKSFGLEGSVASLHRKVDQVLLDAGIREKEEQPRVSRGNGTGEANLPAVLEDLR